MTVVGEGQQALGSPPLVSAGASAESPTREKPLRVAVVGVPNCGKSLLWGRLARRFTASANYPYTTSKVVQRQLRLGGREVLLVDTPGITGLELCSEDEAPTRQLLRDDPPDLVIQCADATDLARSLILTAQLADLEIPLLVCLTMVDEAMASGWYVDHEALAREIGAPVLPACARDGRGVKRLGRSLGLARPARQVRYRRQVEDDLARERPRQLRRAQRLHRLLATRRGDSDDRRGRLRTLQHALHAHSDWAERVAGAVQHDTGLASGSSPWTRLGAIALHPLGGWALLLLTIAVTYVAVAEVGVKLLADSFDRLLATPLLTAIGSWTGAGPLRQILVGQYGLLSLGLFNALATVLPILSVFYLVYGFLEDIGYFPLLSVQFDRLLRLVGLTGRAVLPMTLGFGCNTVATMATRGLDGRQRLIACFLIALGTPCAVQLGVMLAILSTAPLAALVGLLALVIALQVIVGSLLARLLPRSEHSAFLIELPPLRPPQWRNIFAKTYHRLRDFVIEAVPLFVAGAALMLLLDFSGLLGRIRALLAPIVVEGLGLPERGAEMLLMTIARREVGAVMMKDLADSGALDLRQIFVGLLVMTLFVPCVSNTLVMGRALGWLKTALIFFAVTALALGCGLLVNLIWIAGG